MKRKWQVLISLLLTLVTVATVAVPALAQDDDAVTTPGGALAIIAPWTVPAGGEFTVRVFLRADQEPFPGAGVWAIGADSAEKLKTDLGSLRENDSLTAAQTDYENILNRECIYFGRTGEDGRLACTFDEPGRYLLVAGRNGFLPGFTTIGVRDTVEALAIRAPRRARADVPVTINVFERITQDPVAGAAVWAVSRDKVASLQADIAGLKADTSTDAADKDYESVVSLYGELLGRTSMDGSLEHTFDEAGGYLLVAVKLGYVPGFSPLAIVDLPDALAIRAPLRVFAGREFTLGVLDRQTGDLVENAGVWAVSRDKVASLQADVARLKADTSTDAADKDYESVVSLYGLPLGMTGADGRLTAAIDDAGGYLLVTVKGGYIPGFAPLVVHEDPDTATASSLDQMRPGASVPVATIVPKTIN
jgi:uncharacterized small protein (DUF1192 family)